MIVPFIANIWGFISQSIVFKEGVNTTYGLAMTGAVFSSLEGKGKHYQEQTHFVNK